MTVEKVKQPPWPPEPMVLLLDELSDLTLDDLSALDQRFILSVGAVRGTCDGSALAAALAVDLLVAAPDAVFGRPGKWADIVIRRGTGIAGRKVMAYLTMTNRTIDAALAGKWGIVTSIAGDPVEAALGLAGKIAGRSQVAVATILRQCRLGTAKDYIDTRLTGAVR
ncbi:hypothetical protein ACFL9T_22000 [Thermodesulfobacteriota bacterium]